MSDKAERSIRKLFAQEILPLAEAHRAAGEEVMAANPSSEMASYYTEPEVRTMSKADFETGGAQSVDGFEAALRALWSEESRPEYARLARRLGKLARSIRTTQAQSAELSQFVYVMY